MSFGNSSLQFNNSLKDLYGIETSQLIFSANQLTGFFVLWVFTERFIRADINIYPFTHIYTILTKTLLIVDSKNPQAIIKIMVP